jgi:transglutaminase-like putative cysteine protease
MLLTVYHATTYRYAEAVARSTQTIRLSPFPSSAQKVRSWQVELPAPGVLMNDTFDNPTHLLTLNQPHDSIRILAQGEVEISEIDEGEPAGRLDPRIFLRSTSLTQIDESLLGFIDPMRALIRQRPLIGVTDLMHAVLDAMPYTKDVTDVSFNAAQSFEAKAGVCQDHAHVYTTCCRALGLPARYVSGYVYTPELEEVASHAWAEVWLANRWLSFDISNARNAGGTHLKLAIGLDYNDACPVRGIRLGGGEEELSTLARVTQRMRGHQQ